MNHLLVEDLEDIVNSDCIDWKLLHNQTILVTGATGLIGSLVVKALAFYNKKNSADIKILALIRNTQKAEEIFEEETLNYGVQFIVSDIMLPLETVGEIDFIIHGASITKSKEMVTQPVETIFTAVDGTKNVLNLAREKKIKSMVYISSMEVYGITDPEKKLIFEEDLGYIDPLSVRSSYSEGKRCCEMVCAAYYNEFGVPVKIVRMAQTFGAGVSKDEDRAFAQFAKSAANGNDIILHTKGESIGNYCYSADAVKGLLCVLTRGSNGEAYTLVNEEATMPIKEMAALVAEAIGDNKIKVVYDIPDNAMKYGYAPDVTLHLSGAKARKLGWEASTGLEDMFKRMVVSWQEKISLL